MIRSIQFTKVNVNLEQSPVISKIDTMLYPFGYGNLKGYFYSEKKQNG